MKIKFKGRMNMFKPKNNQFFFNILQFLAILVLLTNTSYSETPTPSPTSSSVIRVKIKDLVTIKGVRENPIIGYGLVIGLKGTGDGASEITTSSLKKMLKALGLNPKTEVTSKNVAAVVVTANLPAFPRVGQRVDVTISSIGDASSLGGGTLIVTPLKAGDGEVYAVANGSVSLGGLENGTKITTTARIPNGAVIEKEFPSEFDKKQAIRMTLNSPDFTTAARLAKTINTELSGKYANARDSATIDLIVPSFYERSVVELIGIVENFTIVPDQKARVVINERTGTVVAGGNIILSPAAIAHKDMMIKVGGGEEAVKENHVLQIGATSSIDDLVKVLNSLGATPEDLISIFQTLHKNGSLNAEIDLI